MSIDFSTMDGYEFEDFISSLFHRLGFEVEATNYSNDGGVDLVATFDQPIFSGKYIIQCKNWTGPVGQPEVRDLYGVVMDQRANKGILITPSDYTQQAYDFANGKNIELINGPVLSSLLTTDSENSTSCKTAKPNDAFRNERYSYYQKAITEDPKKVSNYLQMIRYLRGYVKEQNSEMCTMELFDDIISWTDKLINKCFKATSKTSEREMATMLKVEALIHTGRLAEATECLLKTNTFRVQRINGTILRDDFVVTHRSGNGKGIFAWNLLAAFRHIQYVRGCKMITARLESFSEAPVEELFKEYFYDEDILGCSFIYPIPEMVTLGGKKTKHFTMEFFYTSDIKDPSFFYKEFYKKSSEEYAQEIDEVFKLHGLI